MKEFEMASTKKTPEVKKIRAQVAIYMQNQGDGSAIAKFFSDEIAAEAYASHDDERFTDDVYTKILEFDENGKLLNPTPSRD